MSGDNENGRRSSTLTLAPNGERQLEVYDEHPPESPESPVAAVFANPRGRPAGSKSRVRIITLRDLRVQLVQVWNQLKDGEITEGKARAYTSLGNTLKDVIVVSEIEPALARMKGQVDDLIGPQKRRDI